jgi:transcriptional regulator of acetoin/glycerol metabolism
MGASPSDVVAPPFGASEAWQKESPSRAAHPSQAPLSREPTAEAIRACIHREEGNVRRAAHALGLPSRYALYRLMRKHGIEIGRGS